MGNIGTEQMLIEVLPAGVPESEPATAQSETAQAVTAQTETAQAVRVVTDAGGHVPAPVPTPLR
jgi:hypothetical protein